MHFSTKHKIYSDWFRCFASSSGANAHASGSCTLQFGGREGEEGREEGKVDGGARGGGEGLGKGRFRAGGGEMDHSKIRWEKTTLSKESHSE